MSGTTDKKVHDVSVTETDQAFLRLTADGKTYQFLWEDRSPRLAKASYAQRVHMEVSPSGYGIHWPEIDEDLAITPLLEQASTEVRQVAEKKAKYGLTKHLPGNWKCHSHDNKRPAE